jgi:hypothetical protein
MQSIDSDTQAFKVFLADQGLTIFNEQSIEHGYQIVVTDGLSRNPVNFYKTSRILVQGKDSVLKTKLTEWTNLRQAGVAQGQQEISSYCNDMLLRVTCRWIALANNYVAISFS